MTQFAIPKLLDPLEVRENLGAPELSSLSEVLDKQEYVTFGTILTSLVQSQVLGEVLAEFDRIGCGEINFEGARIFLVYESTTVQVALTVIAIVFAYWQSSGICASLRCARVGISLVRCTTSRGRVGFASVTERQSSTLSMGSAPSAQMRYVKANKHTCKPSVTV